MSTEVLDQPVASAWIKTKFGGDLAAAAGFVSGAGFAVVAGAGAD
jgi:hypothetical protein